VDEKIYPGMMIFKKIRLNTMLFSYLFMKSSEVLSDFTWRSFPFIVIITS